MCGRVVREVLHSVHGFVHGGDVFDRSLLLVLVMVHDVVDATKTCSGNTKDMHSLIHINIGFDGNMKKTNLLFFSF